MLIGHKFRLYPNAKEQSILRLWIGHQRFIYNAKTQEQDYWFNFYKHSLSLTGLSYYPDQSYSQFRNDELTPWLNLAPPEILRNGSYKYITAYKRFTQGVGGSPNRKKAFGRQSVMITSELFSFYDNNKTKDNKNHKISIGNKKFPLGKLLFKAHKEYNLPKSITISVNPSGHWFISFNSEEIVNTLDGHINNIIRTQEELMYEFSLRKDLDKIVVGIDRGVVLPVATSNNSSYSVDNKVLAKIAKKEARAKRYQRKLSRQQLGSKNRNKTKNKIGKLKQYQTNVRQDFCHKTSHDLVNSSAEVFVLEDLKLKNMMKAPKPKQYTKGNYLPNGSAAKAGLNKSLANSSLGTIKQFINYKAAKKNKLVLFVNPAYSSQECSECHFIHKDNRLSQSIFKCTSCGHEENADSNAAKVIKYRGIEFLKSFDNENYKPKSKKTISIRKKVGKVLPEPISDKLESKPVENMLDIKGINLSDVQRSMNQETPTTSSSFSGG